MKKALCLFLASVFLLGLSACGTLGTAQNASPSDMPSTQSPSTSEPPPSATPAPSTPVAPSPSDLTTLSPSASDRDDLSFADLSGLEFWFGSGVGAWCTTVDISPDGTFTGYFHDSDMGDTGDGYPNGTAYECTFSGKFTSLTKADDFTYSMKCEFLKQEGTVDEVKIIDGVRTITAGPRGFDSADEFLLYLPGKKLSELPEEFLNWVNTSLFGYDENISELPFYGLYNVGGQEGFSA